MINPEELEILIKAWKEAQPEITKLTDEALHQFGFTEKEEYKGLLALGGIFYAQYLKEKPYLSSADADLISAYKDLRTFLRTMSMMATSIMHYIGILDEDAKAVIKGTESLGKWIEERI